MLNHVLKQGFQSSGLAPRTRAVLRWLCYLGYLNQCELYQQALVARLSVVNIALVHQLQRVVQECYLAFLGLLLVACSHLVAHLQQWQCLWVACHQHVTHMLSQTLNQQSAVKAFVNHAVQQHHNVAHLIIYGQVDNLKVVLAIQHVQVLNHLLVGDVALTERSCLVEDREGVAHSAISLLGNHCQCLLLVGNAFLLGHMLQVVDGVAYGHTLKVVYLATAQDGGQNLMLLGGGQNEYHVCGWLFQRLQKSIEGGGREHVHLVDDKYFVFAQLRRDARLLHQGLDVLY